MRNEDIAKLLRSIPEARDAGDGSYWNSVVPTIIEQVLDEIATSYDFDFVMAEYSSTVTIANQADYNLRGKNNDLRDIVSIRYGTGKVTLTKMRTLDADDLLSSGNTIGGTKGWYQFKVDSTGFPIVTLFDAPNVAGNALHTRYRMKDLKLEQFPASFGYVIAYGALAWVSSQHYGLWQKALKKLVKRHKVGGKDINIGNLDPHIVQGHNRQANLNRVG